MNQEIEKVVKDATLIMSLPAAEALDKFDDWIESKVGSNWRIEFAEDMSNAKNGEFTYQVIRAMFMAAYEKLKEHKRTKYSDIYQLVEDIAREQREKHNSGGEEK